MAINRDEFRDLTRRFLEGFVDDSDRQTLNEVTPGERADALRLAAEDMAAEARTAHRLATNAKRSQLTLNQPEVDAVAQMADQIDKMYHPMTQIHSIPQTWLDNGDYEKLLDRMLEIAADLEDLAVDMKKSGI